MKNDSKMNRAFYLFLVPIVAVVVLLNSGLLQRWFTAATVYGEEYSAVRYNYYYFSVYHEFLAADYAGSNYNVNASAGSQQYDEDTTWKEHFAARAEERMVTAAYYHNLAREAGWTAPREVLKPLEEKLTEIRTLCAESGLSEKNYFSAYYGAGMDRDRFAQEMKLELEALAYRDHLESTWEVDEAALESWLAENPVPDGDLFDLWVVELKAVPGRTDGQVGEEELDALEQRVHRLAARYGEGTLSPEEMSRRYGDVAWGEDGHVKQRASDELPAPVALWCGEAERAVGDRAALVDRESGRGWLVELEGLSGSSARKLARERYVARTMAELEAEAFAAQPVKYHKLGLQMATN